MKDNRSSTPPINVGDEYTGRIDSVGEKGDGIFRVKGFVVFVPNVKRGDFVKVKITKVLAKVSFGEVTEKVEPPKNAFAPPKPKEEDLSHLLTTAGDSEDFGEDEEE
ncbi:TRAM domain-containing protein [Candidatus Woesearchaeota archaeon]|nr:TRAM domain-containing protein [Candidatus Woesearchaeota archaeon]